MNCVNCGHSMKAHDGDKCTGSPDCVCKEWQRVKFSVDEISTFRAELAAYKAEAMAARAYIDELAYDAYGDWETPKTILKDKWQAARVKDGE